NRSPQPPATDSGGCPVAGELRGLECLLSAPRMAGSRRGVRPGEPVRRCYGRRHSYRHTDYHLREWHRRRRAALQRNVLIGMIATVILPLMTVPAIAAQTVGDLPSVIGLAATGLPQDMLIYDRRGNLLADVGDHGDHRVVLPRTDIPPNLINATTPGEDDTRYP